MSAHFIGSAFALKTSSSVRHSFSRQIHKLVTMLDKMSSLRWALAVVAFTGSLAVQTSQSELAGASSSGWVPMKNYAASSSEKSKSKIGSLSAESVVNSVNSPRSPPAQSSFSAKLADESSQESGRVRRHSDRPLRSGDSRRFEDAYRAQPAGDDEEDQDNEQEAQEAPASGRQASRNQKRNDLRQSPSEGSPTGNEQANAEYDEAAERAEQEAAEASEADAANKSALDEARQQQREIIRAQAASEAKAIREQQEALMRQQRVQQQMLMKRQHELESHQSNLETISERLPPVAGSLQRRRPKQARLARLKSAASHHSSDIQFSDQPDKQAHGESEAAATRTIPVPVPLGLLDGQLLEPEAGQLGWAQLPNERADESKILEAQLMAASLHSYGSGYGSLHGHQKDYYQ